MWLDRLKEMKKQSKKTSKEISECTGIPKSTTDKLFAGQTKEPFLSSVRLIVHCLGYTLDDLDDETEYYNNPQITITSTDKSDNDKQKLLHNYESLNNTGKNKLLEYSDDLVASGKYSDTVTIAEVARTNDNRKSLTERQVTAKELEIFDIAPQSDEEL